MDFPYAQQLPLFVHSISEFTSSATALSAVTTTQGSHNSPAGSEALFIPFAIPWPYPVRRVFWANGTTPAGNNDFGIYSPGGARIFSTGAVAQAGASTFQYSTPAVPFMLSPGAYLFAISNSSGTNANKYTGVTTVGANEGRITGMLKQAAAHPLPDQATFAQWTATGLPLIGITRTPSGF